MLVMRRSTRTCFFQIHYPSLSTCDTPGMNMYALQERSEASDYEDGATNVERNCGSDVFQNDGYLDEEIGFEHLSNAAVNFNVNNLKDVLKCVSCQRFLFPPILQCVAGHMECKACFELKPQCGKCHAKMVEVPAKFAEMITEQFKVQCSFSEKGCRESIAFKVRRVS